MSWKQQGSSLGRRVGGGLGAWEPLCLTQPPPAGGGPDELAKRFQSGRIMYGLCRLSEPATGVPRVVLIHWVRAEEGELGGVEGVCGLQLKNEQERRCPDASRGT